MVKPIQQPKTILTILFLVCFLLTAPSLWASEGERLDVDVHLGLLSGAGVICNTGKLSADYKSCVSAYTGIDLVKDHGLNAVSFTDYMLECQHDP